MLVGITDERFGTVQRHTFQHDFLAHISNNTTLRVIWEKESCDSSPRLKAGAPSRQNGGKQYHLGGHSSLSTLLDKLASHDVPVDERVLIALELEEQFPLQLTPLSEKD